MSRQDEALMHLNWTREAEKNEDFLRARVEYIKCVECWKQANQTGECERELQDAAREYEKFVTRDPIYAKIISFNTFY